MSRWRAGCSRAPGSTSARSNAAHIGRAISRRARRWRARAARRRPCTTTARASMRAFVCVACAAGVDHHGYVKAEHLVQREVRGALEGLTGVGLAAEQCGIDGCSIPTWAVPLDGAGARLCTVRHRAGAWTGARQGGGAHPRRLRGAALLRRRHRALLHRDHEAVRRARAGEDRRRRRVLRRAARNRASASRSSATTARRAPPRSRWRR